ncbi:hypothetical protein [Streptomyces sp. JW3]|uniref:hypothetical protein n=1 Tax=Streptomyces sp. JW3 TaxID=3456955 RepID=UPI003FA48BDF
MSTPLARTLGATALGSAAVAWLAAGFHFVGAPRWDVLVPLALAAVSALGWLLACRAAPAVRPLPVTAPPSDTIPGKLGPIRRDWGFAAAAWLTVWAPYVAGRTAWKGDGSPLGALYCLLAWFLGVVLTLFVIGLLKNQLYPAQRMLRADAAGGGVHAVRVRFGTPLRGVYRYPTGTGVGKIAAFVTHGVELVPENGTGDGPAVRLLAMEGHNFRIALGDKHLTHAAAQLVGHTGWLCWPTRWRDIAATNPKHKVPAAFVSDSGHVVWGETAEDGHTPYLRGGAAPLHATSPARAADPLPRPSRYFPKTHASHLRIAAVGALLAVPYLTGVVSSWPGMLLGVAAGAAGLFAGMTMDGVGVDKEPWTTLESSHPSLR